jgi:acyl carrier protein
MNDVKLKVYRLIEDKLGIQKSAIDNNASFYDDLGVDSLDFCEFIVDIEKTFNLNIPDEAVEKFNTVGSVVNYLVREKNLVLQD